MRSSTREPYALRAVLRAALTIVFSVCVVSLSRADTMQFTGYPPSLPSVVVGNAWHLFADGEIDDASADRFDQFLRGHDVPRKSLLFLSSPGGNLLAGIKLGKVIRAYGLFTYIGQDAGGNELLPKSSPGECYSACALSFWEANIDFTVKAQNTAYTDFTLPQKTITTVTWPKYYLRP